MKVKTAMSKWLTAIILIIAVVLMLWLTSLGSMFGTQSTRPSTVPTVTTTSSSSYLIEVGLDWLMNEIEWGPEYQSTLPYELGEKPSIRRKSQAVAYPESISTRFENSLTTHGWTRVGTADTNDGTVLVFTKDNVHYLLLYFNSPLEPKRLILEYN